MKLRPAVAAFAQQMEERLRLYDAKHGPASWRDGSCDPRALLTRAQANVDQLADLLDPRVGGPAHPIEFIGPACDVANLVMMFADMHQDPSRLPIGPARRPPLA